MVAYEFELFEFYLIIRVEKSIMVAARSWYNLRLLPKKNLGFFEGYKVVKISPSVFFFHKDS